MREVQRQIAEVIANERQARGMSREAFSKLLGVGLSTLTAWETGRRIPRDIETVDKALAKIGSRVTLGS